MIQTYKTVYFG